MKFRIHLFLSSNNFIFLRSPFFRPNTSFLNVVTPLNTKQYPNAQIAKTTVIYSFILRLCSSMSPLWRLTFNLRRHKPHKCPPKYFLCSGSYPANYRRCSVYRKLHVGIRQIIKVAFYTIMLIISLLLIVIPLQRNLPTSDK